MSRKGTQPAWIKSAPQTMQDLYSRLEENNNRYWDVLDPNRPVEPMSAVFPGYVPIPEIEGMDKAQELIDLHLFPRLVQLWRRGLDIARCGTYFVKRENWIVPPPTARPLDLFTDIPLDVGVGLTETLLVFEMPDRFTGVIDHLGYQLEDPASFTTMEINFTVNDAPVTTYGRFRAQLGRFNEPTAFRAPVFLKHGDRVRVTATNFGLVDELAMFRLQGFIYPVREVTDDGSFGKYHTL